ncbi:hypothetical protein F5X68DRAFT_227205 [Plectosphaerella plurivora]|uniref:Uncharacterized protein n=1 Tax=Plectosphaerella plurivora TaxID=936078 RepID=A0A9P8VLI0_9PEZI|nr:hypothetical protein F5X68DRAFT_227205 [Plectosphaerella plurivora]
MDFFTETLSGLEHWDPFDLAITGILSILPFSYMRLLERLAAMGSELCSNALVAVYFSMKHFGTPTQLIVSAICATVTITLGLAVAYFALSCLLFLVEYSIKLWQLGQDFCGWTLGKMGMVTLYLIPVIIIGFSWNPVYFYLFWGTMVIPRDVMDMAMNGTLPDV